MTAWLRENPPKRSQFRSPRRAKPTGLIVVHTAESVMDTVGPDTGAEGVARFIRDRTDPGSYHRLCDSDSILALVDFADEAWQDGTGSNPYAMGLSAACRTTDWRQMTDARRRAFIANMAAAAREYAAWVRARYGITIPARWVTRAQSEQGMPGFINHGERDPTRRSDPGADFPRAEFLAAYAQEDDMPSLDEIRDVIRDEVKKGVDLDLQQRMHDVTRATATNAVRDAAAVLTALVAAGASVRLVDVRAEQAAPLGGTFALANNHCVHVRPDEIKALLDDGAWMDPEPWTFTEVTVFAQHFGLPAPAYRLDDDDVITDLQEMTAAVVAARSHNAEANAAAIAAAVVAALPEPGPDGLDEAAVGEAVVSALLARVLITPAAAGVIRTPLRSLTGVMGAPLPVGDDDTPGRHEA